MAQPASPGAGTNPSSAASEPQTEMVSESQLAAPISHIPSEAFVSHATTDMQERLLEIMHENLKTLESQIKVEQQRQRDRLEEELYKTRQQLAATTREQRQQHQNASAMMREMLEDMRKGFSDTMQRLAHDMDHALRQSEAHNRQAIDKLRDEILHVLFERDQTLVKRETLGELLVALGRQLQMTLEDQST